MNINEPSFSALWSIAPLNNLIMLLIFMVIKHRAAVSDVKSSLISSELKSSRNNEITSRKWRMACRVERGGKIQNTDCRGAFYRQPATHPQPPAPAAWLSSRRYCNQTREEEDDDEDFGRSNNRTRKIRNTSCVSCVIYSC